MWRTHFKHTRSPLLLAKGTIATLRHRVMVLPPAIRLPAAWPAVVLPMRAGVPAHMARAPVHVLVGPPLAAVGWRVWGPSMRRWPAVPAAASTAHIPVLRRCACMRQSLLNGTQSTDEQSEGSQQHPGKLAQAGAAPGVRMLFRPAPLCSAL